MKKFLKNNRSGFTLIELLVVIAILAVLATLYVPRILSSSANAEEKVEIANARTLASEITMYNFEHPDEKITGGAAPAGWEKYKTGYTVLAGTEASLTGSHLLDGRDFPSTTYVRLVIDGAGNCFIVDEDGNNF